MKNNYKLLIVIFLLVPGFTLLSQTWTKLGLDSIYIHDIFFPDNSTLVVSGDVFPINFSAQKIIFNNFGQGLLISKDTGITYSEPKLDGYTVLDVMISKKENKWYAAATQLQRGGVIFSTDNGASWQPDSLKCDSPYQIMSLVSIIKANEEFLSAAVNTSKGLIKTEDGFDNCYQEQEISVQSREIKVSAIDPKYVFISNDGQFEGGVYRSFDSGTTWRKEESGLEGKRVLCLMASSHRPALLYCGVDSVDQFKKIHGKGIYRSEDTGRTWKLAAAEGSRVLEITEHPRYPKLSAAACGEEGVMFSANLGAYWEAFNSGLPENAVVSKVEIPSWDSTTTGVIVFAGVDGHGLFRSRPLITSTEETIAGSIIEIYPNPFTDKVNIDIPQGIQGHINISIINPQGETIWNYSGLTSGNSRISWQSDGNIPSGMYFLNINAGIVNEVHKLIKVK
jgi:photosystem II stability/assembly factor-like uncharacterized protein